MILLVECAKVNYKTHLYSLLESLHSISMTNQFYLQEIL